jgi:cytochrome c oxidase cbb3-type subunit 1
MMAIKTVNALSHYTDWTNRHVHAGALGWVAFISIGSLYYLIPRLYRQRRCIACSLITRHFWVATLGVVLYISAMWIAGVTQGLMWRAVNPDGTLTYAFVESVKATYPYYAVRCAGRNSLPQRNADHGVNVWKTVSGKRAADAPIPAAHALPLPERSGAREPRH